MTIQGTVCLKNSHCKWTVMMSKCTTGTRSRMFRLTLMSFTTIKPMKIANAPRTINLPHKNSSTSLSLILPHMNKKKISKCLGQIKAMRPCWGIFPLSILWIAKTKTCWERKIKKRMSRWVKLRSWRTELIMPSWWLKGNGGKMCRLSCIKWDTSLNLLTNHFWATTVRRSKKSKTKCRISFRRWNWLNLIRMLKKWAVALKFNQWR